MPRVHLALVAFIVLSVLRAAGAAQPAPEEPSSSSLQIEARLHAGRFEEALVAITRLLRGVAPPLRVDASMLSLHELPLLAAIVTGSPATANLVTPERLAGRDLESYWYVQGVLAGRAAWPGGRAEPLRRAREASDRLQALAQSLGRFSVAQLRRVSVLATIAAAQEERDEFTLLAAHASQLDAQLRGLHIPEERLLPWDELAGDLWLQIDRYDDALTCYRVATARHPERTRGWIGRARAAREAGLMPEARDAARHVLANWAPDHGIDAVRAEMSALLADAPKR